MASTVLQFMRVHAMPSTYSKGANMYRASSKLSQTLSLNLTLCLLLSM